MIYYKLSCPWLAIVWLIQFGPTLFWACSVINGWLACNLVRALFSAGLAWGTSADTSLLCCHFSSFQEHQTSPYLYHVVIMETSEAQELVSLIFSFSFFFFFFVILGLHPWNMEVPKIGVESELQLPAYTTATAEQVLSLICDLHHSSQIHYC